jgi:hydrogenase maturation protein HypF
MHNKLKRYEYYTYHIQGIVQGVGFRPYIFRKAKAAGLYGQVKNVGNGVEVIINDPDFMKKLLDLPPLAKVTGFRVWKTDEYTQYSDFRIAESSVSSGETLIPPDIFMCDDCLSELKDQKNRRYKYYFVTCTNCGPRYSIIEDYPYDRPNTSMSEFSMCKECGKEYTDPFDRRFHAQTIACKGCGPRMRLKVNGAGQSFASDEETLRKTVEIIRSGIPVAIKGIGGFHIVSLAEEIAVKKIREIISRPDKPFALMVKDIPMAKRFAVINEDEEKLLAGPQRPILVLKKKDPSSLGFVSELDSIGIMLPYTSLHHLLFDSIDSPLVMTSCNISGEPISDEEILCSSFLTHDRKIINRCDDSVIKVIAGNPFFLRRSRGYVPLPVKMPLDCIDTIAVGAEMNNCISIAKKNNCYLSQYIGQTGKLATFEYMKGVIGHLIKITRANPMIIACDLHPDYNSTQLAKELSIRYGAKLFTVQHHKAHIAGVAAEHGLKDYVGIAMDGLGYGEDGNIWGGEVFDVSDSVNFTRIGSLEEVPQLGGDSSAIYPKKMLFGILSKILVEKELLRLSLFDSKEASLYISQLKKGFNVQMTTSAGRILDAVSAFLGLCDKRTYDGRPAMILESIATAPLGLRPKIDAKEMGREILSTTHLFRFLLENKDMPIGILAATSQMYLAHGLYEIAAKKNKPIVFSGGVAYNRMISGFLISKGVLVNKEIPAGDGGICYGQAYLANLSTFR